MPDLVWIGLTLGAALLAYLGLKRWAKAIGQPAAAQPQVRVLGAYSPVLTQLRYGNWPRVFSGLQAGFWRSALWLELGAVALWGVWFARSYLNLDPSLWPSGADFSRNIQLFFQWPLLRQCGACVLWSGTINGGAPAFGDFFTPILYPPVILTTLVWGGINGAKLTLVLSFVIAGLAQWWLARVLGLGRVARLWSAAMAVVGGHLAGRMQMGHIVMVTSVSAASLVLAPALHTALTGQRRSALVFGAMLALALVSGHGYIQISLLLGVLPALLLFVFDGGFRLRPHILRAYLLAAAVTVLLAGVYWLPLAHFWGHLSKIGDATFDGTQPVVFALLNLVINDYNFFNLEVLGHKAFPAMYMMYISWVPLALGLVALRLAPRRQAKVFAFFVLAILLIYFASSAALFKLLTRYGFDFFSLGRYPSLIAPLAVPLILGLAAWGLDALLKLDWPRLALGLSSGGMLHLPLALLLVVPLTWGLASAYQFNQSWLATAPFTDQDYPAQVFKPTDAQWVAVPYGELNYIAKALNADLKIILGSDFTAWNYTDRQAPPPFRELTRDPAFAADPAYVDTVNGVLLLEHPENRYAAVQTEGGVVPCTATALGGNIDVFCQTAASGTLTVQENLWPGWSARLAGGAALPLGAGPRLTVSLPAGDSHILFRYRPWDVTLGLLLTLLGLFVVVRLWSGPGLGWRDAPDPAPESVAALPAGPPPEAQP